MEGVGGSSSSVVPTGAGLLTSGSQATEQDANFTRPMATDEQALGSAELRFRAEVGKMLDETMGSQRSKTIMRHSEGMEWLGGAAGLRMVFIFRSKIKASPVTVRDKMVWLPADAEIFGAKVGLEALGLKPLRGVETDEEKIRKS